jgi:DNA polymerase-1
MTIRRLYPHITLTRTLTGRLATSGFPVLGLPKHTPDGQRIRGLVRAPAGCSIYEIDYSQIELRAAAELSNDAGMIQVFRDGIDLHTLTAHEVLGAPAKKEDQDEATHRLPAKAANFGYWMGMSPKGLTEQVHKQGNLGWSANCPGCKWFNADHDQDCQSVRYFQGFDARFPGAPRYQRDRMAHAERTGMAFGMWGEQWALDGVWSQDPMTAEATKRQAFALPIQSGAQRLIKQAMRKVYEQDLPWAARRKALVEPCLQIHDSLVFVVWTAFVPEWHKRIKRTMETITTWKVPIVAEGSYGPTWAKKDQQKLI